MFGFGAQKRVYLDYAAATPLAPHVKQAMEPYWQEQFANPSAIHYEGVLARRAVEEARARVARVLGVRPRGIVFTASGTESNNLAIGGVLEARRAEGVTYAEMEVLTTAIEHPSVTRVLDHYAVLGVTVRTLPIDADGRLVLSEVKALLSKQTALVTVGYVNSEIGTIQPLSALVRTVREFERTEGVRVLVHTDAAQAPLWLPCQLETVGVDLLSLDAGKCYGPKGVGVLALRHGVVLQPVLFGGGQEFGMRSGTENTPLTVGTAVAVEQAQREHKAVAARVQLLRDHALAALTAIPGITPNGSLKERVANNVNISIAGVEAEFAVISLDTAGFAISAASACSGPDGGGSRVVRALSDNEKRAQTAVRITLGRDTTERDIDRFIEALTRHIEKTRTAFSAAA